MNRIVISLLIAFSLTACASTDFNVDKFESHCSELSKIEERVPFYRAPPKYPWQALSLGIEGYVQFEFEISTKGHPINLRVIESYPGDLFVSAAHDSVKRHIYEPVLENGKAVVSPCHQIQINFAIAE